MNLIGTPSRERVVYGFDKDEKALFGEVLLPLRIGETRTEYDLSLEFVGGHRSSEEEPATGSIWVEAPLEEWDVIAGLAKRHTYPPDSQHAEVATMFLERHSLVAGSLVSLDTV